mmetsp:Transcript_22134/g.53831  ORF Transcript_22134/g.53831 Transcript_22134/m.53831 type:complete len:222 (+) Transcript_22134:1969-2634(+)
MLPRLDLIHLLLAHLKEALVPNGARLDDLRDPRPELPLGAHRVPLGEAVEEAHVHEDYGRLVEGAHEVLAHRGVDGGLAADTGVDHGEEGGGHLDKGHTPHVCARDKASQVPHHTPPEGDTARVSVELVLQHEVLNLLLDLPVLGRLPAGHDLDEERLACRLELGDKHLAVDGVDILVGYKAVHKGRHPLDKLVHEVILKGVLEADDRLPSHRDLIERGSH